MFIHRNVGKFPAIMQGLALGHEAKGDVLSALVTVGWVHASARSFIHSFIRSFVLQSHSFVPSFVLQSHSFVHSLTRPIAFVRSLHVVRLNGGIYARSSRVGCRWGEMSARTHRSEGGEATFKTWR